MVKYHCKCCQYITNRHSNYVKHIQTIKHQKQANELVNINNPLVNISPHHKCKYCDNVYKHKSSLCNHMKQKHHCKKNEILKLENNILYEKIKIYENLFDPIS